MLQWHTVEDFEADLRTFSEIQPDLSSTFDEPPPPSLLEYQSRLAANSQSIYDADFHHSEDVTYLISGRGRGGISKIYKPGATVYNTTKSEDDDIRRRIRQETGVTGYDRAIEQKYARLNNKPEISLYEDAPEKDVGASVRPYPHSSLNVLAPTFSMPRAKLDKSPTKNSKLPSASSSSCNTPTSLSMKCSTSTDLDSSPSSERSSPVAVRRTSPVAVRKNSPVAVRLPVNPQPLPLSELRKKARKKPPAKESSTSEKEPCSLEKGQCSGGKENKMASDDIANGKKKDVVEKAVNEKPRKASKSGLHSSPSSNADSVCMNDYWWRKSDHDSSMSSCDEPLSWRKREKITSPPRFFKTDTSFKWNDVRKPKHFDVLSDDDFPPLK